MRRAWISLGLLIALSIPPALIACSSDSGPGTETSNDGGPDGTTGADGAGPGDSGRSDVSTSDSGDAGASDARPDGCPTPVTQFDAGDTCVGIGTSSTCSAACGLPQFEYVCYGGGPPGINGCVQTSYSAIVGGTYCCGELKCVRSTFLDPQCADAGAPPHFHQCASGGDGGLLVQPPIGCQPTTGPAPYKYYCCP
jgi:hypothetical protein